MALTVKTVKTVDSKEPGIAEFLDAEQDAIPKVDPPESLLNAAAEVSDDRHPGQGAEDNTAGPDQADPVVPLKITAGMRNDIKGKLALFGTLVAAPLDMVDPYCGRALSENADNMVDKALPLILRSPGAVQFLLSTSGGFMDWLAFLQACWPVITAIYAHHLARSVMRDSQTGQFIRKADGGSVARATIDNFDYSAK